MPLSNIGKRNFSILVVAVLAMSSSLARAGEEAFDPATVEFQQPKDEAQAAASKSKRRARKLVTAPSRPSDSPGSHAREEEAAPQSGWSGSYGGLNAGAAGASAAGK